MKGLFITFEGCEGCGKSTLSKSVAKKLEELKIKYILTREPGGTDISEKIRNILLDPENKNMTSDTEALLYAASRAQHTQEKIIPALEDNNVVLCDRYIGSSIAYQGNARGRDSSDIEKLNDFALKGFRPDIEFFINTTPQVGFERMKERKGLDRLEQESIEFHNKVYEGFKSQAATGTYTVELDGTKTVEELTDIVISRILGWLK